MPVETELVERIGDVQKKTNADYITVRRLSELVSFPAKQFEQLTAFLRAHDPRRLAAPLWSVRDELG